MIIGAHSIIYSKKPDADRAFFREILEFPYVDIGEGWLIFRLPPAEIAIHPSAKTNTQEIYLMCDNIQNFIVEMREYKIKCTKVKDQVWGLLTHLTLPGGGKLGIYEPKHERP